MDGDYYSPTHRRRIEEYANPDEALYIITTPNIAKLSKLTHENFSNLAHSIHASIESKGVIVLDGIGKHSKSTDSLLELANILIVLCPDKFCVEHSSEECGYVNKDEKIHPFDFYYGQCEKYGINASTKYIRIRTHFHDKRNASFDQDKLEGELLDLDWGVIKNGKVERIPQGTRDTILGIAKLILKSCYRTTKRR